MSVFYDRTRNGPLHLSHGVNPQGKTYGELPYHPGHSSLPRLVSRHVPCPPYFCHASCIRSVPSPVNLSCTYNLSFTGLSLPCLPVIHIYLNPTHINPSIIINTYIYTLLLYHFQQKHKNNSSVTQVTF